MVSEGRVLPCSRSRACPAPLAVADGRRAVHLPPAAWLWVPTLAFSASVPTFCARTVSAAVVLAAEAQRADECGVSALLWRPLLTMRDATTGSRPGAIAIDHKFKICF